MNVEWNERNSNKIEFFDFGIEWSFPNDVKNQNNLVSLKIQTGQGLDKICFKNTIHFWVNYVFDPYKIENFYV